MAGGKSGLHSYAPGKALRPETTHPTCGMRLYGKTVWAKMAMEHEQIPALSLSGECDHYCYTLPWPQHLGRGLIPSIVTPLF